MPILTVFFMATFMNACVLNFFLSDLHLKSKEKSLIQESITEVHSHFS